MKTKIVLYVLPFLLIVGCNRPTAVAPPDTAAEMVKVENLLEKYVIASENQDCAMMESIWSPDEDIMLIGTDRKDRLVGWKVIKRAYLNQFSLVTDTYISVSDQYIRMNAEANTAWFSQVMKYNFIFEGAAHSFEGLRFTGVVTKKEDGWKIVQAHLSVPANLNISK